MLRTTVVLLAIVAVAFALPRLPQPSRAVGNSSGIAPFKTMWTTSKLDHFGTNTSTFAQRWLVNDEYWGKSKDDAVRARFAGSACPGPVLFYTGNEGDITLFWANTGVVTGDLIYKMGPLVVFVEHRYYGLSLPFGNASFAAGNVQWLSVEQALADYAVFLQNQLLAAYPQAAGCPVVSFGGSYGGMLAGWFRMKYPDVTVGAIAASAPILMFLDAGTSQWAFGQAATNTLALANAACPDALRQSLLALNTSLLTPANWPVVSKQWNLCSPIASWADANNLVQWVIAGVIYMDMTDYPYPNDFLEPVGTYVSSQFCQIITSQPDPNSPAALFAALKAYYNYTGWQTCYNTMDQTTGDLGMAAWNYQACTELVLITSFNGTSDAFLPAYFNVDAYTAMCQQSLGVTPNYQWYQQTFAPLLPTASNIIFTHGQLDPWGPGSPATNVTATVYALEIQGGAHHLDLRTPVPDADPASVTAVRAFQYEQILKWIGASQ